jgi:hypothetical protein
MTTQKRIDLTGGQWAPAVVVTDSSGNPVTSSSAPSTGTLTSIASAATDTLILAANSSRKGAVVYNESTAVLYLLLATGTSSATAYSIQIPANGNFTLNPGEYTGIIKGIWASANGFARVTEFA